MPQTLWSGNLRLSLVLIPVRMYSALSSEDAVSFHMIHEPSGQRIKYLKGIREGDSFTEVPEDEIVKGYEYAKGHYVLLHPRELDELKLEAKHTINMERFVDEDEIDIRYWEKPYYLVPDGEEADEPFTIMREALKATRKVAIGQLIMRGREHLVGIKASGKGFMLSILRYTDEIRPAEQYFKDLNEEATPEAVTLAKELIERESSRFEPEKMPDEFAAAIRELIQAKIEQRAPEITVGEEGKPRPPVVNIMAALKESMEAKARAKVRDGVRRRMGKGATEQKVQRRTAKARPSARRTAH
jgi:DNA end-binding protein Ku